MESTPGFDASGYWYGTGDIDGVDLLNLLRRYRQADVDMRRRTRDLMGMGETDLLALRYLLKAQRRGERLTASALAKLLGISTASTTVLIDRLARSGHVARESHPSDRRSVYVVPTARSDSEVRETLGVMHRAMIDLADSLSQPERLAVARFLTGMIAAVDGEPAAE